MPAKSTFGSASVIPYSSSSSSYKISRSLRFNSADGAYLTYTPTVDGDRKTWTYSTWIKRTKISSASSIFFGWNGSNTSTVFQFTASDNLELYNYAGAYYAPRLITNQVLRDLSAWYHIILVWDANNATSSDRQRIYINGQRVTSFSTESYSNDIAYGINVASYPHGIGGGSGSNFDGYIAETHFIDGQALTPSSFGYTDSITGSWLPKKYVGTYGINGFYLPFTNQSSTQNLLTYSQDFGNVAWLKYVSTCTTDATTAPNGTNTADKLVVNNGETYGQFYRAYTATDNTTYTASVYLKALDFTTGALYLSNKSGGTPYVTFDLTSATITGTLNGALGGTITSVGSGWYRITCTMNSGTGASTTYMYIQFTGNGDGVKGSYIWGAQLEAYSSAGPYMYTAASVQAQTLTLGEDRSLPTGGYNNWVAVAFSVAAGSGNDSLLDTPTDYGNDTGLGGEVGSNYATFNSVDLGGSTLTNGNLDISSAANQYRYSTMPLPQTGKWYFEFTVNTLGATNTGFWIVLPTLGGVFGLPVSGAYRILKDASDISITGSGTPAAGHTMKVAYDADNKRIWFGRDTLWFSNAGNTTSDPSDGTNPSFSNLTSTNNDSIYVNQTGGGVATCTGSINFGQRPFAYAAPTGFKTLCTANMPTPTIKNPKSYMNVATYTGTNAIQSISSLGFSPDLVWIKSRSTLTWNFLFDSIRGATKWLASNQTGAEATNTTSLISFNSDGFSLSADPAPDTSTGWNAALATYVAWCWSKNSVAGMDIVSYTGTGANMTINHSLGAIPKMIINKSRSAVGGWPVYHASLGNTGALQLESSGAFSVSNLYWNNTSPTASDFTVNAGLATNGTTYINYLFAEIDGYSKFGSYTGNGSTDGPFVWCGFRPKYILIKTTGASYNWWIIDTARGSANVVNNVQFADLAATDYTTAGVEIDIISSGFKIRNTNGGDNGSSVTYIFAAFAEYPFKYARAR